MQQQDKETLVELLNRHRDLGITEQIDFKKFYLYSIIAHSTAIEGSTVTEVEAQLLFDEGITSSKRTIQEQMMNLDLKAAYEYGMKWIQQHNPITVEWLISLAAKVMEHTGSEYSAMAGSFSAAKGELRKLNVSAGLGGPSYMSYQKVPSRLAAFCEELNSRRASVDKTDPCAIYDLSFWAHYELVTIHPWADGNGRTSRLLMNLLQMEYDLLPVRVLREDKTDYIQALADARENDDIRIFLDCMTRLHIEHLRSDIEQFLKSTGDGNGDGRKEATRNDVAEKLTERQSIILSLIGRRVAENVAVNTKYLSEKLNVNRKTIQRDIAHLRERELIQWVGSDKTGHWELLLQS
jgi:Fic family protein